VRVGYLGVLPCLHSPVMVGPETIGQRAIFSGAGGQRSWRGTVLQESGLVTAAFSANPPTTVVARRSNASRHARRRNQRGPTQSMTAATAALPNASSSDATPSAELVTFAPDATRGA
jgi:hypothetical protein